MADKAKPFICTNIKSYVPIILDLNELNYDVCCEIFLTHFRAYGLHDYLDGTITSKGPTNVHWDNLDNLVKSWLYGTMTQLLLTMIFKPKFSAQSIWDNLEALFQDNKHSRAIELDNELHSLVQGDWSITDYCQKMKSIANLLVNIEALVIEKTLVTYLLNGLNPKFDNISLIIRHKDTHVTFLKARSTLVSEEFHINRMHTSSSNHYDHGPPQVLLANSKPDSRRPNHNRSSTT
ncbi:uncharacterized protein LOC111886293 [Lactuca sativa]|uniref:uncharacterized protein LOC111886293 n=1 Tax=Lactuca sativa TaxID=4236 RepID=UPI000CD968A4|nr:uncharacterized protein LOC111886293 [Lactuca sativa]